MKIRKLLLAALAAILTLPALPLGALAETPTAPEFNAVTGTVTSVETETHEDGATVSKIAITYGEGAEAVLIVDADTFHAAGDNAQVGDTVTGYYDATRPMIMIYPPQYQLVAVAVNPPENAWIAVDRFSGEPLLSSDGKLQMNLSGETSILFRGETEYTGDLNGAVLAVYYSVATASMPAQISPSKVVVLAEPKINYADVFDLTGAPILVEGRKIDSPDAFWSENNAVMVAVKPIAEALGMSYSFDEATGLVTVDKFSFTVGQDGYALGKMAPRLLGDAPVLVNGAVYVPLNFFTEVAGISNAYYFEGQIDIDNGEKMQ